MKKTIVSAVLLVSLMVASTGRSQTRKTLPFTQEEDADGSFFAWLAYKDVAPFERVSATELKTSPSFKKITPGQPRKAGDLVAWSDLMGIDDGQANVILGTGTVKLADLEKQRGPATWYRWQERRKAPQMVSRARLGMSVEVVNPDPYVWLTLRESAGVQKFILQFDRRPIRMMSGEDAIAALSLIGERVPAGTTARQYAEVVAERERLPVPGIAEANELVRMEGDCADSQCRLVRTVRVSGTTALMALCALPKALEDHFKPDCDAWLRSAKIGAASGDAGVSLDP